MPVASFNQDFSLFPAVTLGAMVDVIKNGSIVSTRALEGGDREWTFSDGGLQVVISGPNLGLKLSVAQRENGSSTLANVGDQIITSVAALLPGDLGESPTRLFTITDLLDPHVTAATVFSTTFLGSAPGEALARLLFGVADLRIDGTRFNDNFDASFFSNYASLNLAGDNRISLLAGDDAISAGSGDDVVTGGIGKDQINGDDGNDRLFGGNGNDRLDGGAGRDRIDGGFGRDRIDGGTGSDRLTGGGGADVFVMRPNQGHDIIADFVIGIDVIDVPNPGAVTVAGTTAGLEITVGAATMILLGITERAYHNHEDAFFI